MKKLVRCAALLAAVVFASCDNKGNSYDFAQILYPNGGYALLYADETSDSLRFATTYDWTLSNVPDWMHINPDSMAGHVPSGYFMYTRIMIGFDVNRTDTVRTGVVHFNADGKTLQVVYNQLGYLNVSRPGLVNNRFEARDSARQVRDSLVFTTYGDGWTLAFEGERPEWIDWETGTVTTGKAGKHSVAYTLKPNTSEKERTAVLQLTSKGVTTDIHVRQYGLKQEDSEE